MAVIQLAKQLFGMRSVYQRYSVKRWMASREKDGENSAYKDLIRGLGYGKGPHTSQADVRALFNLPINQLAAQISLAADLALSFPEEYAALMEALTGGSGQPSGAIQAESHSGDSSDSIPPGPIESSPGMASGRDSRVTDDADQDIRRSHLVRGSVDALQLSVGQGWRRYVRATAVLISGILGVIWVGFLDIRPDLRVAYMLSALFLGGFISWVLRDFVAIIERLRR